MSIFLPYRQFNIESSLSTDEVVNILQTYVTPNGSWHIDWHSITGGVFKNDLLEEGFNIEITPKYRKGGSNFTQPYIVGKIRPHAEGSQINIFITLHPLYLGFFALVLIFLGYCFVAVLTARGPIEALLAILAIATVTYLTPTFDFGAAATTSERILRDAFDPEYQKLKNDQL